MGEIIGYVTQTRGAAYESIIGVSAGGSPPLSRNQFAAMKADMTFIGTFESRTKAQRAVERSTNGGRIAKWSRDVRNSLPGSEMMAGASTEFYPGDLGDLLLGGAWWRADQGVGLGPTPDPRNVRRWFSFDGSGGTSASQLVGQQPTFAPVALGGRPAVRFAVATAQRMSTSLLNTLAAPLTAMAVVNYVDASRKQIIVQSDGGFELRVAGDGTWGVLAGASSVIGPAATDPQAAVISAISEPGSTEAFLNGVSFGTAADAPAAGDWEISDPSDAWAEDISEILILPYAVSPVVHQQLLTYFSRRYNLGL